MTITIVVQIIANFSLLQHIQKVERHSRPGQDPAERQYRRLHDNAMRIKAKHQRAKELKDQDEVQ